MKTKKFNAYLFGPFFGELTWEFYRFAPYAIYLKKLSPETVIIVLTRPDRFDLYGKYASIIVPLNLKEDENYIQDAFRLKGYSEINCECIKKYFYQKYYNEFNIIDHFSPDVGNLRYNIKWQFPRDRMDYDFQPRQTNIDIIDNLFTETDYVLVDDQYDSNIDYYNGISNSDFLTSIYSIIDDKRATYLGCLIEMIKRSRFTISNLDSVIGRLSLLLGVPLIYPNCKMTFDEIHLLNPNDTPVINCENENEGVKIYNDNF
jgi:hypothetical protein